MFHINVNLLIIAITTLVSILAWRDEKFFFRLVFHPYLIVNNKQWYRLFSYGLVHANWVHLIVNMFVLYSFGGIVESSYVYLWENKGHLMYALLYVSALAISSVYDLKKYGGDYTYSAVGASGATSAVVFASIMLFPLQKIYIFFIPIGIPAIVFGVVFMIYSVYMSKRNADNIGHNAHFWGAVYGFLFVLLFDYRLIFAFFNQILH